MNTLAPEITSDIAQSKPENQLVSLGSTLKKITVETRSGKPACRIDDALKLVSEFNRLFTDSTSLRIDSSYFLKRDDEEGILDNAYDVTQSAIFEAYGIPPDTSLRELPEDLKWKYIELQVGLMCGRPNPITLFENGEIHTTDAAIALVDTEKDPFGKIFIQTALEDLRINIGDLLKTMGHKMDIRSIFPTLFEEPETMRRNFKRLIDELLRGIGLEKSGPAFAVMHMGPTKKAQSPRNSSIVPAGPVIDISAETEKDIPELTG